MYQSKYFITVKIAGLYVSTSTLGRRCPSTSTTREPSWWAAAPAAGAAPGESSSSRTNTETVMEIVLQPTEILEGENISPFYLWTPAMLRVM